MAEQTAGRSLSVWLFFLVFLVFSMVAVGGLTRLTRSGLSIVEWKPVSGVLPPLNDDEWQQEFAKYQRFPEYQKVNQGMTLGQFQYIFYWEYFHRLLGRLLGVVFAFPLGWFALRKAITPDLRTKLLLALAMGGLQGALGWFMVKSGLADVPQVSHYRLAAHLSLALFLMCFLFWLGQDLRLRGANFPDLANRPDPFNLDRGASTRRIGLLSKVFLILVAAQIFFGALTAGLHAGYIYNTFPTMNGAWLPGGLGARGGWRDILENPGTVQFVHRCLGWAVLLSGLALAYLGFRNTGLHGRQRRSLGLIGAMVAAQFLLGVLTLLNAVPLSLAALHQIGACILILLAVNAVMTLRLPRAS